MIFVVILPSKADSNAEIVNLYQYTTDKTAIQWAEGQVITLN